MILRCVPFEFSTHVGNGLLHVYATLQHVQDFDPESRHLTAVKLSGEEGSMMLEEWVCETFDVDHTDIELEDDGMVYVTLPHTVLEAAVTFNPDGETVSTFTIID